MDMTMMNQRVIEQFRSGAPMRMPKARMLLLTTTGRRTGRPHTTPMMFVRVSDDHGEHIVVAGSNAGSPIEPDWVRNLRVHPDVTLEFGDAAPGTGSVAAIATVADDAQRTRWWPLAIAQNPVWGGHQEGLARAIPLIELTVHESKHR